MPFPHCYPSQSLPSLSAPSPDPLRPNKTHKSPPSLLKAQAKATTWSVARLMTGTQSMACSSQPNMFCSCCTSSCKRGGVSGHRKREGVRFLPSPGTQLHSAADSSKGLLWDAKYYTWGVAWEKVPGSCLSDLQVVPGCRLPDTLSLCLPPSPARPWLTEVRSFSWIDFLSSTTWPRRPVVNWGVRRG